MNDSSPLSKASRISNSNHNVKCLMIATEITVEDSFEDSFSMPVCDVEIVNCIPSVAKLLCTYHSVDIVA